MWNGERGKGKGERGKGKGEMVMGNGEWGMQSKVRIVNIDVLMLKCLI